MESQAERLTVNGLGGEDRLIPDPAVPAGLAGLTAITVNGGSDGDRLVGGDGAGQINGGSGADELFGGETPARSTVATKTTKSKVMAATIA